MPTLRKSIHTQPVKIGRTDAWLERELRTNDKVIYRLYSDIQKTIGIGTRVQSNNSPLEEYKALRRLEKKLHRRIYIMILIPIDQYWPNGEPYQE